MRVRVRVLVARNREYGVWSTEYHAEQLPRGGDVRVMVATFPHFCNSSRRVGVVTSVGMLQPEPDLYHADPPSVCLSIHQSAHLAVVAAGYAGSK